MLLGEITLLEYAVVVPQTDNTDFGAKPMNRNRFIHGVVANNGPDYLSHIYKNKPIVNKQLRANYLKTHDENVLTGHWLYLGCIHKHFGHFLAECTQRMWSWSAVKNKVDGCIIVSHPTIHSKEALPDYIQSVLQLFGIPLEKVRLINQLTKVEALSVPEPGSSLGGKVRGWYERFLRRSSWLPELVDKNFPKKVFVSRKNYPKSGRLAGIEALERFLESRGYLIFSPEEHDLIFQFKVVFNAEFTIWEEGSAEHLLELLPRSRGSAIHLCRRLNNRKLARLIEQKYESSVIFASIVTGDFVSKKMNRGITFTYDIDALLNTIESNGFVQQALHAEDRSRFIFEFKQCEKAYLRRYTRLHKAGDEENQALTAAFALFCELRNQYGAGLSFLYKAMFCNWFNDVEFIHQLNNWQWLARLNQPQAELLYGFLTRTLAKRPPQEEACLAFLSTELIPKVRTAAVSSR